MKKLLSLLLLATTLLTLAACGSSPTIEKLPDGMQIAERGDGYTFYAPEDWVIDRSTGITTAYVSAVDPSNVTLVRIETDETAIACFEASREKLNTTFDHLTFLDEASSDNTTFGGKPAIVRVYSGTLRGTGTSYTVKQYLCRQGAYLYLFTYTAKNEIPSGKATYFERYEETVDEMASVFAFSGKAEAEEPAEEIPPITNADGLVLISDPAISRYSLFVPKTWTPDLRNGITSATREGAFLAVSYEIPKEDNIVNYWAAKSEAYASFYEDYAFIEAESSTPGQATDLLGNQEAACYVFTFTKSGVTYKTKKLMTLDGIYVYTLTYTAVYTGTGEDPYTAYLPDLAAITKAFTFD